LPWGFFSLVTNLGMGSLLGNSATISWNTTLSRPQL
jgi:hypothetical protein